MCPQNAYSMPDADGKGSFGDPSCGDYLIVYIKVTNNIIEEVSYLVFGCVASVATSSMTSVLAKGKSLDEAMLITENDVIVSLDGLPEGKQHCSNLAVTALRKAINNYYKKRDGFMNSIVIIGTKPPCPRCQLLINVLTEKNLELGLEAIVEHLDYTSEEAKAYAKEVGLATGTAKDVSKIINIDIDVKKIADVIDNHTLDINCEFNKYNNCNWSIDLDNLLRPFEEKAKDVGILMTPVLIINGHIKHQGSVPELSRIEEWLMEIQ